jgi:hypothetical protein
MRHLATLAVAAAVVGVASADIAIPPPKGKKFIPVNSTVKLEKEVKGYVLMTRAVAPGQWGAMPQKFQPSTEKAIALPEWGSRTMALYAVPDELAAKITTADQFNKAIQDKKSGILTHDFPAEETVDAKDERKKIERAFVIQGVDEKGIKVAEVKDEKKGDKKEEKKEEKKLAFAEPGYLIGGLALAAGVACGGLWLLRRRK